VATRLAMGDNFNDQIIKLLSFMSHFDLGFSPHLLQCKFEKKPWSLCFSHTTRMKTNVDYLCKLLINTHFACRDV
jgi:hypothetical protein